jgi:hypothetical protein
MQKCLVEPLGEFGDYQEHLGCYWCEVTEECKKETEKRSKKPSLFTKKNKGHSGLQILRRRKISL